MKELGDWELTIAENKDSKIYTADNEHLIRYRNNDLAEVINSGSDIVIKTREAKITVNPSNKSIHITPLSF